VVTVEIVRNALSNHAQTVGDTVNQNKILSVYDQLSQLTSEMCGHQCRAPHQCCSPEYCEMAIQHAKRWNVELKPTGHERLPLMGPTGCIAAPHLRPLCTAHVCENTLDRQPQETQNKYFELRDLLNEDTTLLPEGT
jgi:hypothetical protein